MKPMIVLHSDIKVQPANSIGILHNSNVKLSLKRIESISNLYLPINTKGDQ